MALLEVVGIGGDDVGERILQMKTLIHQFLRGVSILILELCKGAVWHHREDRLHGVAVAGVESKVTTTIPSRMISHLLVCRSVRI